MTLRQMYMNSQRFEEMNRRREYEQLKQEVLDYVISHLSASVDISKVLMQIEELRKGDVYITTKLMYVATRF